MTHPTVTQATQLYSQLAHAFNAKAWDVACDVAEHLLPLAPYHAGVHYMMGVARMELGQTGQALEHLQLATHFAPQLPHYAAQLAKALASTQHLKEAGLAADGALALQPMDPWSFNTLGQVFTMVGQHRQATSMFKEAVALSPNDALFRLNLAHALLAEGDFQEAEAQMQACLQNNPTHWAAYSSRANLRRWSAEENHVQELQSALNLSSGDLHAHLHLHMAMAKENEDLGHYENAFRHYTEAKRAGRALRPYSPRADKALFDAATSALTEAPPPSVGHGSEEPIFVIGMPRTGTTLLDRIISSHPEVSSAGELQNFGMSLKRLSSSRSRLMLDPGTFAGLGKIDWLALGDRYLQTSRPMAGATRHFIDKLPHNFIYAGYIASALPNAKIICVRRNPLDTCLSNFRQLFSPDTPYYDYSYDLLDTGRYYVLFDQIMAHWHRLFPGRILEVAYESLVDAQEETTRRVLLHCGLDYHASCLAFHENPQPVATASVVQVRSSMYRTATHRWKRYEAHLGELKNLLSENGISIDS